MVFNLSLKKWTQNVDLNLNIYAITKKSAYHMTIAPNEPFCNQYSFIPNRDFWNFKVTLFFLFLFVTFLFTTYFLLQSIFFIIMRIKILKLNHQKNL